jgi:hypothetical protein
MVISKRAGFALPFSASSSLSQLHDTIKNIGFASITAFSIFFHHCYHLHSRIIPPLAIVAARNLSISAVLSFRYHKLRSEHVLKNYQSDHDYLRFSNAGGPFEKNTPFRSPSLHQLSLVSNFEGKVRRVANA